MAAPFYIPTNCLQCACVLTLLCPTLYNPMDCSLPGSSVHGILSARILEWGAMSSSRGSSQPRDPTQVSHITGWFSTSWATREALQDLCRYQNLWILKSFIENGVINTVCPLYPRMQNSLMQRTNCTGQDSSHHQSYPPYLFGNQTRTTNTMVRVGFPWWCRG